MRRRVYGRRALLNGPGYESTALAAPSSEGRVTLDWERDWPEAIDPETGEVPGVPEGLRPEWVRAPDRGPEPPDWTDNPQ